MKCFENYELKKHTTFKIGGFAKRAFFPESIEEFTQLLGTLENPIILGGCSNVLISSRGVENPVIITTSMKNYKIIDGKITAECGVKVPLLSREVQKAGLCGFEFMVGFPGTVGGVVFMNASAHNQFISDTCTGAVVFDLDEKKVLELSKENLKFCYRHSVLCEKNYILLSADFELSQSDCGKVNELMQKNIDFRKAKQPNLALPNAGSTFKNPQNDSAGRLLELAGVKGLKSGGAQVWLGHANFIVNNDNATSKDVSHLMNKMYNIVKEKYSIELEPEIRFISGADREEDELWDMMLKK